MDLARKEQEIQILWNVLAQVQGDDSQGQSAAGQKIIEMLQ